MERVALARGHRVPPMRTIAAHRKDVHGLAFAPDGRTLASVGGQSAAVWLWDVRTGGLLARLAGRRDRGRALAFGPDGKLIAAADNRNLVRVWRLPDGRPEAEIPVSRSTADHPHPAPAYVVVFLPDGRSLATASEEVRVWALGTFNPPYREAPATGRRQIDALAPSADGLMLAFASNPPRESAGAGGPGPAIKVWSLKSDVVRVLATAGTRVHALTFAPGGGELAAASGHTVRVLDLATGAARLTLSGHEGMVWRVAYTPDGARLVSASSDGTVRFWDAATGAARGAFDWRTGKVRCVAVSPDGLIVASGGQDGRIVVADLDP